MLYIVIVNDMKEHFFNEIVFEGRKPFITSRKEVAEVYAERLKEEFPYSDYRVGEVRII